PVGHVVEQVENTDSEARLRQVSRHGLPGRTEKMIGPVEVLLAVPIRKTVRGLGPRVRGPHQAPFFLHQPQYVLGIVDGVDGAPILQRSARRACPAWGAAASRPAGGTG